MSQHPEQLTPIEARILSVLIEKEKTTPDVYPLTINSLTAGSNQKTSRDPVMNVTESEIQSSLDVLRERFLVIETYGASGRVLRYAHNFGKSYGLPQPSVALLATLMLRGPLTVAELRANSERLYRFEDTSSVEAYLEELATRTTEPLVTRLQKQPGSREHRWAHLLCGSVETQMTRSTEGRLSTVPEELEARVTHLEQEVQLLRNLIDQLSAKVG